MYKIKKILALIPDLKNLRIPAFVPKIIITFSFFKSSGKFYTERF